MLRKMISLFMTAVMLCLMTVAVNAETVYNEHDVDLVIGLGIMELDENEENALDTKVTRKQFAKIVSGILNYNASNSDKVWDFYGEDNENVIIPDGSEVQEASPYTDVDAANEFYNYIKNVTDLKLMHGNGGCFYPDDNIKANEAVAVLLRLLGYNNVSEYNGGWFSGYMSTANDIGIKTVSAGGDVTFGEMASMLVQAIEAPLMVTDFVGPQIIYKKDEDRTILTEIMDINKMEDTMYQNNYTSFTGRNTVSNKAVLVGDTVLTTNDKTRYANGFIGRKVECYYFNENSDNENELIYACLSKKNDETSFNIDNFKRIDSGMIFYESGAKTISKKIAKIPYVIYNGLAVTDCQDKYFDYENGSVTLVSTKNNGIYDLIIIEGYKPIYVKRINREKGKFTIINGIASADNPNISFDEDDVGSNVTIQNSAGDIMDLSMIKNDGVADVSQNDDVIKIIISDKNTVEDFVISTIGEDEITNGEESYKVSEYYKKSDSYQKLTSGESYTLYLNSFGYVAKASASKNENTWETGYVYKFINDVNKESISMKVIYESGKSEVFNFRDKISYSDENGNDGKTVKSDTSLYTKLAAFDESVIRYKLNKDDEVTAVEIPLKKGVETNSKDRLYVMADTRVGDNKADYYYSSGPRSFGSKIFLSDDTQILSAPQNSTDVGKYSFVRLNEIKTGEKVFAAYGVNQESTVADYVCLYETVSLVFDDREYPYIVTNVYQGLNADDEVVNIIEAYQQGKTYKFYDDEQNDYLNHAIPFSRWEQSDSINENEYCKVAKGDLIGIKADSFGNLNGIQIIFDCDGIYDNSKYKDLLGTCDEFYEDFTWQEKGILAGSLGYFTSKITNTNPVISKTTVIGGNGAKYPHNGYPRYIYGYVYDLHDGIITYTTKNLHESDGLPDDNDTRFVTESKRMQTISDLMEIDGDSVAVSSASAEKIKTYKDFGKECSRIIFYSYLGDDRMGIIINGVKK